MFTWTEFWLPDAEACGLPCEGVCDELLVFLLSVYSLRILCEIKTCRWETGDRQVIIDNGLVSSLTWIYTWGHHTSSGTNSSRCETLRITRSRVKTRSFWEDNSSPPGVGFSFRSLSRQVTLHHTNRIRPHLLTHTWRRHTLSGATTTCTHTCTSVSRSRYKWLHSNNKAEVILSHMARSVFITNG